MARDDRTSKEFSDYLDRLLKGEDVDVGEDASEELKEAGRFARRIIELRGQPSPEFAADLRKRLLERLVEEERRRTGERSWWRFGGNLRWLPVATTAVVVLAAVGLFWYTSQFTGAPASAPVPSPARPTTPRPALAPAPVPTPIPAPAPAPAIAPMPPTVENRPPLKAGGSSQVSWAFGFDNLADLTAFSDAIAIGVVDRVVDVERNGGELSTKWAFRVEKTLKGTQRTEVIVYQTGSPDQPGSDISDDPLFLPGERYLLFLRETPSGTYHNFGPWGRYLIWDGKVYSMNQILSAPGARNYGPGELNYDGVDVNTLAQSIVELADSVQLKFTQYPAWLRADVIRYDAGATVNVEATLITGKHGPGKVILSVNRMGLPEDLIISIRPAEFTAYPRSEYTSTLVIATPADLPPGSYRILVEYDFEGVGRGSRTITLNVNDPKLFEGR